MRNLPVGGAIKESVFGEGSFGFDCGPIKLRRNTASIMKISFVFEKSRLLVTYSKMNCVAHIGIHPTLGVRIVGVWSMLASDSEQVIMI